MKLNAVFYVILTTIVLVTLAVMVHYNLPFDLVFYTAVGGQILLIFTVYKVLTDNYKTDKTFDDWYEDFPVEKE
ncbi:hypothetical protein LZ575_19315 [Antarcticibacterium sp. 1MA-6-2]|uniref:hypothetical protein n=1 Tax=Antarcticibacterium sp. 1MA-6-2 TaxID=2908210 RepID=UPI001F2C7FE0|nr:hypothetical protein [Antarcticibacterium sp. 1MA-6-2]UJH90847.1 hypothetical protein LZ575_19315 [Antarcticibacterium sp. 1MA-6-2]